MPHINELIDYTNAVFIVFEDNVLLCKHKKLGKWLPIGGHIELDEDPDEALWREVEEESGFGRDQLVPLCEKLELVSEGTKFLTTPNRLDIHDIDGKHRHVGLVYYMRASSDQLYLKEDEHDDLRWVKLDDLENDKYNLTSAIRFYAREAIGLSRRS